MNTFLKYSYELSGKGVPRLTFSVLVDDGVLNGGRVHHSCYKPDMENTAPDCPE